jgi:hypothetical protein
VSRATKDASPPHPDDWGVLAFTRTGFAAYRLGIGETGIAFEICRLRRDREELIGELTVRCPLAGARTVGDILSSGDFNLSSVQARTTRARHLAGRALAPDMDWEGWLTALALQTIAAERTGEPAQLLTDFARPAPGQTEHDYLGLTLPKKDPAILFGHGGSAKSLLGLALAGHLSQQGEIVLYADWEATGADHHTRLRWIYPPNGHEPPAVLYLRCERPLTIEADRLRALVREHGVTYVVLDSAAYGCPGAPESAEAAIAYFRALRSLGEIGSLVLAHTTKSEDGDKQPFGSSFWHNSARATWHVKRSNPDDDGPDVHVLLSQRKCNQGRLRAAFALALTFGDQIVRITRSSAADVPEFASSLTLLQRIRALVARRATDLQALIVEFPDEKPDTVKRVVRRGVERGILVKLQTYDDKELVGLKSDRTA